MHFNVYIYIYIDTNTVTPNFLPVAQFTTHIPSYTLLHHYGDTVSSPFLIIPMRFILSRRFYWTENKESDQLSLLYYFS